MDRRGFMKLFGVGVPAAVVAEKVGLIEQVRTYFFAPPTGWVPGGLTCAEIVSLELEVVRDLIPTLIESDASLYEQLRGFRYYETNASTGTFHGLSRKAYPKIEWDKALEI